MFSLSDIAMLGAAQGLMLVLAIASIRFGNRRANRFLAAFIAALSLRLLVISAEYQASAEQQFHSAFFALLHLSYVIGPLLYWYVRLLVQPDWQLQPKQWLHLLPVILATGLLFPGGPIVNIEYGNHNSFDSLPQTMRAQITLASTPVFVSLIIYSLLSLRLLRPYQQAIKEQFSAIESINLHWLTLLIWFCIGFALVSFISEMLRAVSDYPMGPRAAYSVIASVVMIYFIGLMGLRQPLIFDQGQRNGNDSTTTAAPDSQPVLGGDNSNDNNNETDKKYQKSGLDEARIEALWQKLQTLMATQQPYLEPGIKLADLAALTHTRPNYLSQVINSKAGESFFDFINRHRIEAAKALLTAHPQYSVAEIALQAGFNSQNVFNGHFKKHLGQTPTQYRKQAYKS